MPQPSCFLIFFYSKGKTCWQKATQISAETVTRRCSIIQLFQQIYSKPPTVEPSFTLRPRSATLLNKAVAYP